MLRFGNGMMLAGISGFATAGAESTQFALFMGLAFVIGFIFPAFQ